MNPIDKRFLEDLVYRGSARSWKGTLTAWLLVLLPIWLLINLVSVMRMVFAS